MLHWHWCSVPRPVQARNVDRLEEQLIKTLSAGWIDFIEENKIKFNMMDAQ